MRPTLTPTWIGLALFVVLLGAGGAYGVHWWLNQPEQLHSSAQKSFSRGEAARLQEDREAARKHYEDAEKALNTLFDEKKDPANSSAWMLRHKVLYQLAVLAAQNEQEQSDSVVGRSAGELARSAWRSLYVA